MIHNQRFLWEIIKEQLQLWHCSPNQTCATSCVMYEKNVSGCDMTAVDKVFKKSKHVAFQLGCKS